MSAARASRALAVCAGLLIALGLAVRIWSLGRMAVNGDEAIVGLMAREILRGHFAAFYWGQSYGGAEPYLVAALFAIFGQSSATLLCAPLLLDATSALLVWRIGRRVFSPRVGDAAALCYWIFPEVALHLSLVEYGFRWVTLNCGLLVVLIVVRRGASTRADSLRRVSLEWAIGGLAAGVGWWSSPEIAYFLAPAAVLVGYRLIRRRLFLTVFDLGGLVLAFVVGALPWIWANVGSGFASLRAGTQPSSPGSPFIEHLRIYVARVLPMYLGLRLRVTDAWVPTRILGPIAYGVVLVAGAGLVALLIAHRRALVLVGALALFPIIYAASPFTWYWSDGRYGIYLAPLLVLLGVGGVAEAAQALARRRVVFAERASLAGALVLAGVLTVASMARLAPYVPTDLSPLTGTGVTAWHRDPTGVFARLDARLVRAGVSDVYANYWIANPMTFEARGTLVAVDPGFSRYAPYAREVAQARVVAWVFVPRTVRDAVGMYAGSPYLDPGCLGLGQVCITAQRFETYLRRHGVGYADSSFAGLVVVRAQRSVEATAVYAYYHDPVSLDA